MPGVTQPYPHFVAGACIDATLARVERVTDLMFFSLMRWLYTEISVRRHTMGDGSIINRMTSAFLPAYCHSFWLREVL